MGLDRCRQGKGGFMHKTIFSDGVTNIALRNGMVRIEFGTLSITEKDEAGNPAVFERYQLALTPKVFLETFGNMERMLQLLIDNGVAREKLADEQRAGPARDAAMEITADERRGKKDDRRDAERRGRAVHLVEK